MIHTLYIIYNIDRYIAAIYIICKYITIINTSRCDMHVVYYKGIFQKSMSHLSKVDLTQTAIDAIRGKLPDLGVPLLLPHFGREHSSAARISGTFAAVCWCCVNHLDPEVTQNEIDGWILGSFPAPMWMLLDLMGSYQKDETLHFIRCLFGKNRGFAWWLWGVPTMDKKNRSFWGTALACQR